MSDYQFQHIATSDSKFVEESLRWMKDRIHSAIKEHDSCIIGLSGGSTPGPIFEELGQAKDIDWTKVHIFLVDDRYISLEDKDSNQNMLNKTLFKNGKIGHLLFPDPTIKPIEDCCKDYEKRLKILFASSKTGHADFVTLGLGPDGHIASLFPPVAKEGFNEDISVIHTTTTKFAVFDRITVSIGILKKAKEHVFFMKGKDKLEVWNQMVSEPNNPERWPAQEVLAKKHTTLISC